MDDKHSQSSELSIVLAIAVGGAIGSAARYAITVAIPNPGAASLPLATLVINVSGSFLIGLFMVVALESPSISVATRLFLTTGFCGGYTTMSAFSVDAERLLRENEFRRAALYVLATTGTALVATLAGMMTARRLVAAMHTRRIHHAE